MTPENRDRTLRLLVFLLPLGVVQGAAFFLAGPGPQAAVAVAGNPAPPEGPEGGSARPWTQRERAVAAHVTFLAGEPFGPSPLDHRQVQGTSTQPVVIEDANPQVTVPLPKVKLQVIWTSRHGDVALIDGRQYSEGDTLESFPWIVRDIDGDNRCVLLEALEGGQTVRIHIDPASQPPARRGRPR